MPRARIPNASLIASAESPLLPFLAPRVFAESPIPRKCDRHNEQRCSTQEEKGKGADDVPRLRPSASKSTSWSNTTCTHPRSQGAIWTHPLLHTNTTRWRSFERKSLFTPAALLYAEISSFARERMRRKPTVGASPRRVASRTKQAAERTFEMERQHQTSGSTRRGPLNGAWRARALALERERLATVVYFNPDHSMATRWRDGHYRSLRRRITNLRQWDLVQLDLTKKRVGLWDRSTFSVQAFAALERSLYPTVRRHTRRIVIRHDSRCVRWSANLFRDAAKHELHQTWKNWMALDIRTRKLSYLRLLVYLLDRKPGRAMQFIHVLANDPLLRDRKSEAIADALGHLSKLHAEGLYSPRGDWSRDKTSVRRSFVPAFFHIYCKALAGRRHVCSQDLLFNIVGLADTEDLSKVFDCLIENRAFLGFDTILHYANAFAKAGKFQSALRCLKRIKALNRATTWTTLSDRERIRWTCALILRKSIAKGQNYHETPGIVAAIVHLGIKMDILLYNVVMHNAMEAGDYVTAFKVYNALDSNGLKADKHTFSILLHGCASQSNPALFSSFALYCAEVAKSTQDTWLATDYLHYIYARHQNDDNKMQTLAILRQAYRQFFPEKAIELLNQRLRSTRIRDKDTPSSSTNFHELPPSPVALYIVLQAQIQAAQSEGTQQVQALYQLFRLLAQQGNDPTLTELAKRPVIWNAFLLAFCQQEQFSSASQLLKDMTDGSPQPNIYSWNIFMQAFFKTNQVQAAERVFEILRSRGIDPDQYTYGVLLRGYVKAQLVERIGQTMEQISTEEELDADLLRSLARVVKRNQLMLTLEKSRIDKESKAELKAQKEAKEERERWQAPRLTLDEPETEELGPVAASSTREDAVEGHRDLQSQSDFEVEDSFLRATPRQLEPLVEPSPRPHKPAENEVDPDVQYRKLQEQLGLVAPALVDSAYDAQPRQTEAISPIRADPGFEFMLSRTDGGPEVSPTRFGAGLGFKSMLPRAESGPEVSPTVAKVGIRKIQQRPNKKSGER